MDGHELSAASRDAHLTLRRVERQQRLIETLPATRGWRTVASLARDLGVTSRTVERDVERLRQAGVPIVARPGPGGGVRLDVTPG
uniref:helix-turn-helix transcriptional regulator n=1 Tax=uncultured Georgenia sp. TaxID=378209 RepID=UPI002636A06F